MARLTDFRVGDTVMVVRPVAENTPEGWQASWWSPVQDVTLHSRVLQTVVQIDTHYGALHLRPANIYFPAEALERAYPRPDLIDQPLMGPTSGDVCRTHDARCDLRWEYWGWGAQPHVELSAPPATTMQAHQKAAAGAAVDRCRLFFRARGQRLAEFKLVLHNFRHNNGVVRISRWTYCSPRVIKHRKALFADTGEAVATFLKTVREDDSPSWGGLCDTLNELRNNGMADTAQRIAARLEAIINDTTPNLWWSDEIFQCDSCEEYAPRDNGCSYGHNDERYCETCVDNGSVIYSDPMDCWIPEGEARSWYVSYSEVANDEPSQWVTAAWGRRNGYGVHNGYCDCDTYSEWEDEQHEYDNEDEDDEESDGLSGYHSAHRDFTERVTAGSPYPALGVELEVYADDRRDAVGAIRGRLGYICESDGSLCDTHGFEVVTYPMGKPEWKDAARKLLETCANHEVKGYNATGGTYGIHVTVHRRHLSPLQEARMMMFMTASENGDFVKAVAQRRGSYGDPQWDMGKDGRGSRTIANGPCGTLTEKYDTAGIRQRTKRRSGSEYTKKITGVGKYAPICWKENLAEFRVFQSTTYLPSFLKNLEFVWALIEWTSTSACTGTAFHHETFVQWLGTRHNVKEDYPNLVTYLQREKYIVKGSRGEPIHNSWLPILLNTLRRTERKAGVDEELAEETSPCPAEGEECDTLYELDAA